MSGYVSRMISLALMMASACTVASLDIQDERALFMSQLDPLLNPVCTTVIRDKTKNFLGGELPKQAPNLGYILFSEDMSEDSMTVVRQESFCITSLSFKENSTGFSTLRARNVKEMLVLKGSNIEENQLASGGLDDAFLVLVNSNLWLYCPTRYSLNGHLMNYYNRNENMWSATVSHSETHRLCNGGKGYFYGQEFVFGRVAPPGSGIFVGQQHLVEQIIHNIGASFKLREASLIFGLKNGVLDSTTVIGMLQYGISDMGNSLTPVIASQFGLDEGSYFRTHLSYWTQPPQQRSKFKNLYYPFDQMSWLLLFCSFLGVSLLLIIILVVYKPHWHSKGNGIVIDVFMVTWGILWMENHFNWFKFKSRPYAGTLLRFMWVLGTFLLAMAYQATLKASLMRRDYDTIPETLDDVIEMDKPVYYYNGGASVESYRDSSSLSERKLYPLLKKHNSSFSRHTDVPIILQRLYSGKRGFFVSDELSLSDQMAAFHRRKEHYPLLQISVQQGSYFVEGSMGFRKYRSTNALFVKMLHWLMDTGTVMGAFNQHRPYIYIKRQEPEPEFHLSLEHFYYPLGSLVVAWIVGLLLQLSELMISSLKQSR